MVAGAAVAAVKAVGSNQITEILWRKSRKPRCSVNKQINRPINRKQTNAQDTPHQPFSQTLIILDDNSAFTVGNFCWGGLCQLILLLNSCGRDDSSRKLLLLYPSLYASVCLPGKLCLYVLHLRHLGRSALLCELFLTS